MTMEVLGVDTCLEFEPSQTPLPLSQPVPFSQELTQLLDVGVAMCAKGTSDDEYVDVFEDVRKCTFCGGNKDPSCYCYNFPASEYNQDGSTIHLTQYGLH